MIRFLLLVNIEIYFLFQMSIKLNLTFLLFLVLANHIQIMCLHKSYVHSLHLESTAVSTVYFENQFSKISNQIDFVTRTLSLNDSTKYADLINLQTQTQKGVDALHNALARQSLPISHTVPICPQVTEFNRTELRKYISYIQDKLWDEQQYLKTCSSCQFIRAELNQQQSLTISYISLINNTLDGRFCTNKPSINEVPVGTVNLNDSYFKSNLQASNWYYGTTTASDFKLSLFKRSMAYNLTNCPLDKPFVRDIEQICFNCPDGFFNLGNQSCDSCPKNQILNVSTAKCDICLGDRIKSNDVWICKPCNATDEQYYNKKSGQCEKCLLDQFFILSNQSCITIKCNETAPRFNIETKRCQPCGAAQIIDPKNKTRCIKTNYRGICPPNTPFYNFQTLSCTSCPNGTVFSNITQICQKNQSSSAKKNATQVNETKKQQQPSLTNKNTTQVNNTKGQQGLNNSKNGSQSKTENTTKVTTNNQTLNKTNNNKNQSNIPNNTTNSINSSKVNQTIAKNQTSPSKQTTSKNQTSVNQNKSQENTTKNGTNTNKVVSGANATTIINPRAPTVTNCSADTPFFNRTIKKCEACPLYTEYNTTLAKCVSCKSQRPFFNTETKICEKCKDGYEYFEETKTCETIVVCSETQTLLKKNRTCVATISLCQKNQIYYQKINQCILISSVCTEEQIYSEILKTCTSVSSTCKSDEIYDSQQIACIPLNATCQQNQFYNSDLKICQKVIICKPDQKFNKKLKICEKISLYCQSNQYFDNKLNKCVNYKYITSPYLPNLIFQNSDFKDYIYSYNEAQIKDPQLVDCPIKTPYYVAESDSCIACPDKNKPYFNLDSQQCFQCDEKSLVYSQFKHQCVLNQKEYIPTTISRMDF